MHHIEKIAFQLYSALINLESIILTAEQRDLLIFLGVKLVYKNKKYLIKDILQYHLPYQKENFPKELQTIVQLQEIVSSTLDIFPTRPQQLIIAEAQTAGRGQHERRWYSALGRQILLTYHCQGHVRAFDAIWALLKVLEPYDVVFKWPNDLYHASGKIAGVLSVNQDRSSHVSFGLNLSIDSQWPLGSLSLTPAKISREQLIISWFDAFEKVKNIPQEEIIASLSSASMISDFEEVFFNDKVFLFNGLSDDGFVRLRCKSSSKTILVASGSLRPVDSHGWFFQQNAQNSCDKQKK